MPDASEPKPAPQPESTPAPAPEAAASSTAQTLGSATYEIIRQRLNTQGAALRECLSKLDARRAEVFGTIEFKLLQADRILTSHNCIPADMVQLGAGCFLFGFNVQFGLKKEIELGDVFAIYHRDEQGGTFKEAGLAVLQDKTFIADFKRLYNVYEKASFRKFSVIEGRLYMVFSTGPGINDIAVFKWAYNDGSLKYLDGRSEAEFRKVGFPPQFECRWITPDRESYRYGDHPHISIEDRVFVECIGGDLTIKIEDNTATGEGIYAEPVDDKYQKVDDAEIAYAIVNHLILLKIRPYKETAPRYFIFNEKSQSAVRVDAVGQSCVFLPEEHGVIFPDGYYLATGELKQFEARDGPMVIERVVQSPNGEDVMFVFYNRFTGDYALLPYRLIAQKVEERISCPGFSLFPNGHLLVFRAEAEPQKHHMIQLRQTPFHQPGFEPAGKKDAFLYQVGNKEVVRCLAECNEVMTLVRKENPYAELYTDLVKRCGAIVDSYPWLSSPDGFGVDAALRTVREAADKAVDEFDKVRRLQREAVERVTGVRKRCVEQFQNIKRASFRVLNDFVVNLATLRKLRGELITLKEVRYVDVIQVEDLEKQVATHTDELSSSCVKFLLKPEALEPYRKQAAEHLAAVERVTKVAEGREIEKAVTVAGGELEMLIEIVNSLQIDDATETTRIIDAITAVYSTLNQVKAALKRRLKDLVVSEGAAQFGAQMKLLSQAASSFLDLCDTPAKCEEYLNRLSVQLEELEGTFADFEEYTVQLAERRTELYEAFEQRKVALVEQRNRKATALMTAAERILKVIQNRLAGFKTIEDINSYMASDLMIAKVRETIEQLLALGDSVKADDLQGRLKRTQQEAVRQLKDRQELSAGGQNVIKLGKHHFNINTQPLDLTVVNRDGVQHIHLTSTKYFEAITDEAFLATRAVWDQEVVSENREVYRAEYLAWQMLKSLETGSRRGNEADSTSAEKVRLLTSAATTEDQRLAAVQEFMGARYQEGYAKGIHDVDGAKIFHALLTTHQSLQLARFSPAARACAVVYWNRFCPSETRTLWSAKLNGFAERNKLFPGDPTQQNYIASLQDLVSAFVAQTKLYPAEIANEAGDYLFNELTTGEAVSVSQEADQLVTSFNRHLASKGREKTYEQRRRALADHPGSELDLVRDWVKGFLLTGNRRGHEADAASNENVRLLTSAATGEFRYLEEVSAILFCGDTLKRSVVKAATSREIEGMRGSHTLIQGDKYQFDYLDFQERLQRFEREVVPRFEKFHALKQELIERERGQLRLSEFKPKVLTSFMRNQLVDQVYLPLVGDNLAKQIGAAGDQKRTDLMGLLLLISPPGYGKTTLLEYVASRLGIVFIKINGPALGHHVVSLDPEEAPNAAAREEINKLNLALEMGDNAMICVDDIQHCSPEFLQKFISLCDGQRRIEGVWRGKPRTYDLRGRKVVVVMAGNPYTESGQKFKIPDMLANRADTYNLGDIIGGSADYFKASYLENAVTSNAVLAPLANKSQKDIRSFIRLAESGERDAEGFEGSYSSQEVEEISSVMKKLVMIREVVMRVNQEYIHSAAQADEFRVEPPFKLQGSYRNMNRLAEKVVTIMNDDEVRALIVGHYRGESQTLTTGAEANLLKFKELIGALTTDEKTRWEEIKQTFKRNNAARGAGGENDPAGRIVAQLSGFQSGLQGIQKVMADQLAKPPPSPPQVVVDMTPVGKGLEALQAALEKQSAKTPPVTPAPNVTIDLAPLAANLEALRHTVDQRLARPAKKDDNGHGDFHALAAKLGEGLSALRQDLSRAISVVHTGTMADAMKRMEHEMEMVHSTLATLKDMAARQRDHLHKSQELLEIRAKQGAVEVEVTQEMLGNEAAFLEHFQKAIADAQKQRDAGTGGDQPSTKK